MGKTFYSVARTWCASSLRQRFYLMAAVMSCAISGHAFSLPVENKSNVDLILTDVDTDAACIKSKFNINKKNYSPDNFELKNFYPSRSNENAINFPLPVKCIFHIYGSKELHSWASKNDVVAKYVIFQIEYDYNCLNLRKNKRTLYSIGRYKFRNENGILVSRVPESYEVLARIQLNCGFIEDSELSSNMSYNSGYQSHMTFGE